MRDRTARSVHPLWEGCRTGRPPASCTGPVAPWCSSIRIRCGCRSATRACCADIRCSAATWTSWRPRGCTYDCSFCSIIEMRGRNFHPFPIDRVIADIADARAHGAEAIFLVDDNITLDINRFEALCHAILDARFDDCEYMVQAMTAPLAQHGARLAPLMKRAGFRYVFLG